MPLCELLATRVIDLNRPHSFFGSRKPGEGLSPAAISDVLAATDPPPQRCPRLPVTSPGGSCRSDTISADLDCLTQELLDRVWRLADELGHVWCVAGRG